MYADPSGHFPVLIAIVLGVGLIVGGIVGGKIAYDNAVAKGKNGADLFWKTVGGVLLGASIGVAVSGLVIAVPYAIYGGICGLELTLFGVVVKEAVAIGLLAYDIFAAIVAPIIGLSIELIGWMDDKDKTKVPKPKITPKHPFEKRINRRTQL